MVCYTMFHEAMCYIKNVDFCQRLLTCQRLRLKGYFLFYSSPFINVRCQRNLLKGRLEASKTQKAEEIFLFKGTKN